MQCGGSRRGRRYHPQRRFCRVRCHGRDFVGGVGRQRLQPLLQGLQHRGDLRADANLRVREAIGFSGLDLALLDQRDRFGKCLGKGMGLAQLLMEPARPKKVSSDNLPQPYEVGVASTAVMIRVLSVASGSIQPRKSMQTPRSLGCGYSVLGYNTNKRSDVGYRIGAFGGGRYQALTTHHKKPTLRRRFFPSYRNQAGHVMQRASGSQRRPAVCAGGTTGACASSGCRTRRCAPL